MIGVAGFWAFCLLTYVIIKWVDCALERHREHVLDTLTLRDLSYIGLRVGIRFVPKIVRPGEEELRAALDQADTKSIEALRRINAGDENWKEAAAEAGHSMSVVIDALSEYVKEQERVDQAGR